MIILYDLLSILSEEFKIKIIDSDTNAEYYINNLPITLLNRNIQYISKNGNQLIIYLLKPDEFFTYITPSGEEIEFWSDGEIDNMNILYQDLSSYPLN